MGWLEDLHKVVTSNKQAIGSAAGSFGRGGGFAGAGQAFMQGQALDQQRAAQMQQQAQKQAMVDQQNAARQGILQGGGDWVQGLPQQQLDYLGANPDLFNDMFAANMKQQMTPQTAAKPLSGIGKLAADLSSGAIDQSQFDAGFREMTFTEDPVALAGAIKEIQMETESKDGAKDALGKYEDDAVSAIDLIDGMIGNEGKGIKQHKGLGGAVGGWFDASKPNWAASQDTVDFRSMQDQLQGKVFVRGIAALKGLGAMSELEGKKTADAIARLGSAQSEPAYIAALDEVRVMFDRALKRAREKAGVSTGGNGANQPMRVQGGTIQLKSKG